MTVYGPHCEHEECGWGECGFEQPSIKWGCREQAMCLVCGPVSPEWSRLAREWQEWAVGAYGTCDAAQLRALAVPINVVETAELVAAHPIGSGGQR